VKRYFAMALLVCGCASAPPVLAPAPPPPPPQAPDPAELLARDRAFDQAAAERGIDGFMEFIDPQVELLPPNEPLQRGREAMRAHWADALSQKGSVRWQPLEAQTAASGELGYTIGVYQVHALDEKGQKVDRYGKYLTIWRKDKDGQWRVVSDQGSPSPPPDANK
jgi:ketosteroid isomerase-like protein